MFWRRATDWRTTKTTSPEWNTPVRLKLVNGNIMRGLFRGATLRWEDLDGYPIVPLVTHWSPL